MAAKRPIQEIEVDRIFLYEENPRHEPLESEPEVIAHLCRDEQVYNLARSIADAGTNPLELLGVVKSETSPKSGKPTFDVWEGNRRVCAIKLLNDPELAPPHLRKDFARLAEKYTPIETLPSVVFTNHDDLKFWMAIIHGDAQDGISRRRWNAEQKQRHFGTGRNKVAQVVLDLAERQGLITKAERVGKLTTVQRFLNSTLVKEALGIDATKPEDITYNRPPADFQKQLKRFITDVKEGTKVTSRHNRTLIDQYGRSLARTAGLSSERIEPQSLDTVETGASTRAKRTASAAKRKGKHKRVRVEYDKAFATAIEALGNAKLESLYNSVCSVHLEEHTPLVTVGIWAFIESLTALMGRNESTDFYSFYSNDRLATLGITNGRAGVRDALQRIHRHGNVTKHHQIAGTFEGKQLANDVAAVTPLLLKTIEKPQSKK